MILTSKVNSYEWRSTIYKEISFIEHILNNLNLTGMVIEIGGGSGFQGLILTNYVNGLFEHSDYNYSLCHSATKKSLLSAQIVGLKLPQKII